MHGPMLARGFLKILLFLISYGSICAWAAPSPRERAVLDREYINDHFSRVNADSTVSKEYMPQPGQEFQVKYLEIPVEDLHVVDSGLGSAELRSQIFVEHSGKRYFRFFIHPDSEELYRPLIERYGVKGYYLASPTASTRVLMASDPNNPSAPTVYLKLSLDRHQFGFGRLIPDWEVRRGVAITKLISTRDEALWERYGVSIVPEVAGAYIDQSEALSGFIDHKQYRIFQHGMIYRDASFIEELSKQHPDYEIYPLFALFSERENQEPLIIDWWKKSGLSFEDFVERAVIRPVVRATGFLVFEEGLIPDAHGQNILVAIDQKNHHVAKVLFRDIGSMKVNLMLRWMKGHSVAPLWTENTDYDFKFKWSTEISGRPILDWFFSYMFDEVFGHGKALRQHYDGYDLLKIRESVVKYLEISLQTHLSIQLLRGSGQEVSSYGVSRDIQWYLNNNAPEFSIIPPRYSQSETAEILAHQLKYGQSMTLPAYWLKLLDGAKQLVTNYGILIEDRQKKPELVFLPADEDPSKLSKKITHYEAEVPFDQIYAGQSIRGGKLAIEKIEGTKARPLLSPTYPVIRAGTPESPFYQLVDGQDYALYEYEVQKKKNLKVTVLFDISELAVSTQLKILESSGNFWSPVNPRETYQKVRLTQLQYSPWSEVHWAFDYKEQEKLGINQSREHRTIRFAQDLYERLGDMAKKSYENPEQIKSDFLKINGNCEEALAKP